MSFKKAYQQAYKLSDEETENMTFGEAYEFADVAFSEMFAGIKNPNIEWDDN